MEYVEVDGSEGEGGGQILRTAVAFAAILGEPVRVTKIRAGREVPGLRRQHVAALGVLREVFGGRLEGASEGSSTVEFTPGGSSLGSLSVDLGTAASITLVLQAVVPAVALTGRTLRLELTGGTDVPWSPTFDYFQRDVREAFGQMGVLFDLEASRRGYYPRGGGRAVATIHPCATLKPLDLLDQGEVRGASILSRCGGLPMHVAERQLSSASAALEEAGVRVLAAGATSGESSSPGSSILVHHAGTGVVLGGDSIGAKRRRAEEVGRDAAERFVAEKLTGACLDSNLADMVIPLLSLAPGPSRVRIRVVTPHLKSGMEIASKFVTCGWSVDPQGASTVVGVNPGSDPRGPSRQYV